MKHFSEILFQWFDLNYMKINNSESNILFPENDIVSPNIDNNAITSEKRN